MSSIMGAVSRVILLWLGAASASQRRKNKKKALAAAKGRPAAMTLEARPLKYKDNAVGRYAKTWAAPNTSSITPSRPTGQACAR